MDPTLLIETLIYGFLIGGFYAIVAFGASIIYGVMKIVNFAHGSFLVLGGYFAVFLSASYGLNPFESLLPTFAFLALIGVVLYTCTFVPRLMNKEDPESSSLLAFFGVATSLEAALFVLTGAGYSSIAYTPPIQSVTVFGIRIAFAWIAAFSVSAVTAAVLFLYLFRTRQGLHIRAIIDSVNEARASGIDVNRTSMIVFAIGLGLAGMGGAIVTLYGEVISPSISFQYTLIAFVVIVIGGLDDPVGAVLAGILVGLYQSIYVLLFPPELVSLALAVLLIASVSIRPEGILRRRRQEQ